MAKSKKRQISATSDEETVTKSKAKKQKIDVSHCEEDAEQCVDPAEGNVDEKDVSMPEISSTTDKDDQDDGKLPTNTLLIHGLSFFTKYENLESTFKKASNIVMPTFEDSGNCKGYSFIHFPSVKYATRAKKRYDGKMIAGRKISISYCDEKKPEKQEPHEVGTPSNMLFVHNLSYHITEEKLKESFKDAVDVVIPTVAATGKKKTFAIIKFKTEEEATENLQSKQGEVICGRRLLIQYKQQKKKSNKKTKSDETQESNHQQHEMEVSVEQNLASETKNVISLEAETTTQKPNNEKKKKKEKYTAIQLFVNNLSYGTTENHLRNIFGSAKSVRLAVNKETGDYLTYGFVEFKTVRDAMRAMEEWKGKIFRGRKLIIDLAQTQKSYDHNKNPPSAVLFIRNLSLETTEEGLKDAFETALSAQIKYDGLTGLSKGFGFVSFKSADDASEALRAFDGNILDGNQVMITFGKAKSFDSKMTQKEITKKYKKGNKMIDTSFDTPSLKLIIRDLSFNTSDVTLHDCFKDATKIHIVQDKETGRSRGFGFAEFSSLDLSKKALKANNGKLLDGRRINVKYAVDKKNRSDNGNW